MTDRIKCLRLEAGSFTSIHCGYFYDSQFRRSFVFFLDLSVVQGSLNCVTYRGSANAPCLRPGHFLWQMNGVSIHLADGQSRTNLKGSFSHAGSCYLLLLEGTIVIGDLSIKDFEKLPQRFPANVIEPIPEVIYCTGSS